MGISTDRKLKKSEAPFASCPQTSPALPCPACPVWRGWHQSFKAVALNHKSRVFHNYPARELKDPKRHPANMPRKSF
jgi:hypothetical protein